MPDDIVTLHVLRAMSDRLLPPASLILAAAAFCMLAWWRRVALWMLCLSIAALYVLSLSPISAALLSLCQPTSPPALEERLPSRAAIVVLGGDVHHAGPEYGNLTIGALSLERLRYAARLHRQTGLPILVTGGPIGRGDRPLAQLMRDTLEEDFRVPVSWTEGSSRNTDENAAYSAAILRAAGIENVVLVTHAWHMRRALVAFGRQGLSITAAPTLGVKPPELALAELLPRVDALASSAFAVHELVGLLYYCVREPRSDLQEKPRADIDPK